MSTPQHIELTSPTQTTLHLPSITLSSTTIHSESSSFLSTPPSDIESSTPIPPSSQSSFTKYGMLLTFKPDLIGNPRYAIGELWIFCFLSNFLYPLFILYYLYSKVNTYYYLLGFFCSCFQIAMFTKASTTNPGLPRKEYEHLIYEDKTKNFRQCKDCKLWISTDEGSQHCKICNVCIEGYDHHCSLMNICIGKHNLKSFYLYILGSFILTIYFVIGFLTQSPTTHN